MCFASGNSTKYLFLQSLCGEDHIVKGVSVHISNAAPKTDPHRSGLGPGGAAGGPPGQHYGARGGGRDKGHSNFGQPGPGPYGQAAGGIGMAGNSGWNPPGAGGRASMEMPNIQALGLSGNQGGQQSGNTPMAGMAGLNIGALPMNPALVAAALNQAGWGLIGNLGGGGGPGGAAGPGAEHGAFPTPTSFSTPGNVTTTQVGPGHTTMSNAAPGNAAAAATGGILAGWGAAGTGGGEGMPAATPPTVTPQHHPTGGSWPSQSREKHSGGWKSYGGDV